MIDNWSRMRDRADRADRADRVCFSLRPWFGVKVLQQVDKCNLPCNCGFLTDIESGRNPVSKHQIQREYVLR